MNPQSYARKGSARSARKEDRSWIDLRRRIEDVGDEKRGAPRVEFHCPVKIEGFKGEKRITDLSLGGLFIECENTLRRRLYEHQSLLLFMKLPTHDEALTVRARVATIGDRGIGCKFVNLNQKNKRAIKHCFDIFKHTLPIA